MGESGSSLFRRLLRRQVAEGLPSDREGGGMDFKSVGCGMSPTDTENGSGSLCSAEYLSDNSALLSLQPWVFWKGVFQADGQQRMRGEGEKYGCIASGDDSETPSSPRNHSIACGSGRSHRNSIRSSARSRRARRYSVRPINSLENSLIPQLYGDGFEMEEFVFSPAASSSMPFIRPFCVTDGSQIISKSGYDPLDASLPNANMDVNGAKSRGTSAWVGSPPEMKKIKRKSEELQIGGLGSTDSRRPSNQFTLLEAHDKLLLFCLGIGVGVISSMLVYKKEVEQLNNSLKHRENLVQDLQEELDLKDSLTVDELVNDAHEKQQFDYFSDMQKQACHIHKEAPDLQSTNYMTMIHQSNSCKDVANSEYQSQIEAELEAELEILEFNMSSSNLEGITSSHDELDPDLIANVVHGELKADKLQNGDDVTEEFQEDSGGTLTPQNHPVDYSVSPTELSLRLHELNQSMLEERIKELEAKLHHSQKQLHLMELEKTDTLNLGSDVGSSSNHASPTLMEDMSKPLSLSLTGDALYAYEEAYEEFARVTEIELRPSSLSNSGEQVNSGDSFVSDGTSIWDLQDEINQRYGYCNDKKGVFDQGSNKNSQNDGSLQVGKEENMEKSGDDDEEDDEGRMLIQQIMQRVRQDSSVALNAQRMLFSMDK